MPVYKSPVWRTEYPEGWTSEQDEEGTTSFYDSENEVGIMEISCICKDDRVTKEELLDMAEEIISAGKKPSDVTLGGLSGLMFRYYADEESWKEWYLAKDNCMFFITYDCPREYEGLEDEEIVSIIENLSLSEGE